MRLTSNKELTPVFYDESAVKVLECFKILAGKECFTLHWHERMELLKIRRGEMLLETEGKESKVQAGELAIIYPCQPHKAVAGEGGVEYDVIMFDLAHFNANAAVFEKYLEPLISGNITFTNKTDDKTINEIIGAIVQECVLSGKPDPLLTIGRVYTFLGLLYINCKDTKEISNKLNDSFSDVVKYVNENFLEKISTSALSEKFGYNEAYFCRSFKKATGITVTKYIQILRLEYAIKLLKKSNENISAIAVKSGFSDIYYFTNSFKKHFKMTPSEFRKKNKESSKL